MPECQGIGEPKVADQRRDRSAFGRIEWDAEVVRILRFTAHDVADDDLDPGSIAPIADTPLRLLQKAAATLASGTPENADHLCEAIGSAVSIVDGDEIARLIRDFD